MQATYTLATTTFLTNVGATDTQVNLASTSGIVPGVGLFVDRELMKVERLTGIGNMATVLRGQEGTATRAHGTLATIFLAQGWQLYASDPQGLPGPNAIANPHINVANGTIWVIQGDDVGPMTGARSWQQVTSLESFGAFGVRNLATTTPT